MALCASGIYLLGKLKKNVTNIEKLCKLYGDSHDTGTHLRNKVVSKLKLLFIIIIKIIVFSSIY